MRTWSSLAIATALAACAGTSPPGAVVTEPPPPTAPATPALAPAPAPDPYPALNLGFEAADGDQARGWRPGILSSHGAIDPTPGYELRAVDDDHHGGARSLRLRATGGGRFGSALVQLDARPFIGKRLRVHGWVKTAEVTGGAGLWIGVDGVSGAFDNMDGRNLTGTKPWTEVVAEIDVPADAQVASLGALLGGGGTAWFDDLRLEAVTVEPPHPIVVEGIVVDPTGAPAAGAEVALIGASDITVHLRADAGGRFRFTPVSGMWGLSAHRAGAVGAFIDQRRYTADVHDLRIALGKDGGIPVVGRTVPRPAGAMYLQLSLRSDHDADLFAVPVAADGTFSAVLPRGNAYTVKLLDGEVGYQKSFLRTGERVDATFPIVNLAPPGPPPAEVVDHIAKHAIALTTAEAGHGFADLEPVGKLIGDARVVALGEATHGTREFFQLKHRFLEYLVAKQGFTVFAIEANQPECRAINAYVVDGKGNARDALDGIYFWTWNTEEVLAMIEWMRAWNADPKHIAKVQFTGFDMQTSTVAYANVDAFLRERAPAEAAALIAPIAALGGSGVVDKTTDERAKIAAQLAAIGKLFDSNRAPWTTAAGAARFADVRHDVTVLEQVLRMESTEPGDDARFAIRDRSMADNVGWLLDQQPRAKLVVWAHNWHVSNTLDQFPNMGGHLRKLLGTRYRNFGFVFDHGSFQAIDFTGTADRELRELTVGPPPESTVSVAFSRTGKPLLVLDLRTLPARGPVHDWFSAAHPAREIGTAFASDKDMLRPFVPTAFYDAVIFVDKTTRARPAHK